MAIIAGMKESFNLSELRHVSMISHKFELSSATGEKEEHDSP